MERPIILIVDDEPYTADALHRLFRLEPVQVMVAGSGEEAKTVIADHTIHLAIIDYYMPGISGLELIDHLSRVSPQTTNILLSGQANIQSVLISMERSNIHKVMTKPWNNDEMLATALDILKEKGVYPV